MSYTCNLFLSVIKFETKSNLEIIHRYSPSGFEINKVRVDFRLSIFRILVEMTLANVFLSSTLILIRMS